MNSLNFPLGGFKICPICAQRNINIYLYTLAMVRFAFDEENVLAPNEYICVWLSIVGAVLFLGMEANIILQHYCTHILYYSAIFLMTRLYVNYVTVCK